MENQVLQQVLVDGEYVSRPVDVYQLMARAQQQADVEMQEPDLKPQHEVPRLGVLTKTVFPSPFVKFILPANIRRKQLNDVVFVGENSIQLVEIRAKGYLHHIASKADFKGRILAARTFGAPRKLQWSAQSGTPIKKRDMHAARRSTISDEADVLPPEIIVLTLTSRTLMMLWAQHNSLNDVTFKHRIIRLPAGSASHDRVGTFLAVDPKCRAMAVAAPEGQFILYKTKTLEDWKGDIEAGNDTTPIEDERLMFVQGRIMHMEFLSAGADEDDTHVILLFILAHNGLTKITCYDWDSRYDLDTADIRAERVSVDFEDHNPSLLIPADRRPDFLLVCDRHIATYTNVLSGTPQRYRTPIGPQILEPLRPGESRNQPLWVQWQRAPRNHNFSKEVFYVAREDGVLLYVELLRTNMVEISHAGYWPHPLDKAFATLDVDTGSLNSMNADVLIATGPASDGSLQKVGGWVAEARNLPYDGTLNSVESIPCWTPIADLVVTRLPGIKTPHERDRDGIFVANGRAPHGSVTELRRGLRAVVNTESVGMAGCTGLWVLDHGSDGHENGAHGSRHYATFVFCLPPESMAVRVSSQMGTWSIDQITSEREPGQMGISGDEETISAGILSSRLSIQITKKEARVLDRTSLTCLGTLLKGSLAQNESSVVSDFMLAAVTASPSPHVAIAFREGSTAVLAIIPVLEDGTFGRPIRCELHADPTSVSLVDIDGTAHVFVGRMDAVLVLYRLHDSGLYTVHSEVPEAYAAHSNSLMPMVCESAVVLTSEGRQELVCGMRNGILLCLSIEVPDDPGPYSLKTSHITRFGTTAVRVTRSATDASTAFISCGNDFCRVGFSTKTTKPLQIDSIWFTQKDNDSFQQAEVTAIDQLPFNDEGDADDLGGFMFAVSGDRLIFARLECDTVRRSYEISPSRLDSSKAVPRKLTVKSTPTKLMYAGKQRKLVIATSEAKEERAPPNGYRVVHSVLKLINLTDEEPEIKSEEDVEVPKKTLVAAEYTLNHYERVYSLVDWIVKDDKNRPHHFLCIGTGVMRSAGQESGRRLFFQIIDNTLRLKKEKSYDEPVRNMALWHDQGRTDLVTVVGRKLMLERYGFDNQRLTKSAEAELPSTSVCLSVSGHFVYVSTALHSHMCYAITPTDSPGRTYTFDRLFTDSRERSLTYHADIHLNLIPAIMAGSQTEEASQSQPTRTPTTIVLLADKKCNLFALYQPPVRTFRSSTTTLFEASLPRSITRIARGDVRPPWRRPYNPSSSDPVSPTGFLADDIIATCSDGTIYSIAILSAPAIHLLRLLQNLIEAKEARDPANAYSTLRPGGSGDLHDILMNRSEGDQADTDELIKLRAVDPGVRMPQAKWRPSMGYVDADLLSRFFASDGGDVDRLKKLIVEGVDVDIREVFEELVHELGLGSESEDGMEGVSGDAVFETARRWIGDVVMDVL